MIIEEITAIIGEYTPIILEDGSVCVNYAQIAGYALIVLFTYSFFKILGKMVSKK